MDILSRKEFISLKLDKREDDRFTPFERHIMNSVYNSILNDFKLYSYQQFVVRRMDIFSNIKRLIVKWGTGAGKTKVSLVCAHNYLKNGGSKVFIIGLTKNNFIDELLSNINYGIVNFELISELKRLYPNSEYYLLRNKLKNIIAQKGYVFLGYEKLYNMLTMSTKLSVGTYEEFNELVDKGDIQIDQHFLADFKNSFVIIDEAHKLYNSKKKNSYGIGMNYILDYHKENIYLLPLSATLSNNDPSEILFIASLIDYKFKGKVEDYFKEVDGINVLKPNALHELRKVFFGKVSYFETRDPALYPLQIFEGEQISIPKDAFGNTSIPLLKFIRCEMGGTQLKYYKQYCQGYSIESDHKYVLDYATSKGSSYSILKSDKDAKATGNEFAISPGLDVNLKDVAIKAHTLLGILESAKGKSLVYHPNRTVTGVLMYYYLILGRGYTAFGSYPTSESLCLHCSKRFGHHQKEDHDFNARYVILIDGTINKEARDRLLERWNSVANTNGTIINVLIGSRVIEESIDMKAIKNLIVLKNPKNIGSLMQLFGRGIRSGSHLELPLDERKTRVFILVNSLPKGDSFSNGVSYDEHKYHVMMLKFMINKDINTMLDSCSIDLWLNQDLMNNKTNILADHFERVSYKPSKVDDTYFNILYKEWEISAIENIIQSILEITPVWKLSDLVKDVKSNHINIQFNPSYIDDNNILIALNNMIDIPRSDGSIILAKGDYVYKAQNMSYNFMSNITVRLKDIDLGEELDTKIDYENIRLQFYKENRGLSVQKLGFNLGKFNRSFHIKFCQEVIEYIFKLLDGGKQTEFHDFMFNVLYFYDKFNLIIYASQIDEPHYKDYILPIKGKIDVYEKYKEILFSSLTNSISAHPSFTKFDDILSRKKLNPDFLPVGHYLDKRLMIYVPAQRVWEHFILKEQQVVKPHNNIVVGYLERGNDITFEFKLRFPTEEFIKDKRLKKKGIKCKTLYKDHLLEIANKLGVTITDESIGTLCELIKKELIRRELKDHQTRWFYFHFERLPW